MHKTNYPSITKFQQLVELKDYRKPTKSDQERVRALRPQTGRALPVRPGHSHRSGSGLSHLQKTNASHRRTCSGTPALLPMSHPFQLRQARPTEIVIGARPTLLSQLPQQTQMDCLVRQLGPFSTAASTTRPLAATQHDRKTATDSPDFVSSKPLVPKAKGKGVPPGSFNP